MAIPFYEPQQQEEGNHTQHQQTQIHIFDEVDQVDGPGISIPPNISTSQNTPPLTTQEDVMAWKLLALTMCKALKDHYQQGMSSSSGASSSSTTTAVIQILPNGQVKPSWN